MVFDLAAGNMQPKFMNMRKLISAALLLLAITAASCGGSKKITKQQRNDLQDTYETFKRELPEAIVTMDGDKVKVVLAEAVLFKINSADINPDYLPSLLKMAKVLNKYPKTNIIISGFTDITGTEEYNKTLSEKRAASAKAVLVQDEVASGRIYAWGLGAKNPIASNDTELGRKQNRRVEFVIMYDYKEKKEK